MSEFKIGDRVRIVEYPDKGIAGMTGTIKSVPKGVPKSGPYYAVILDHPLPDSVTNQENDYLLLTDAEEMEKIEP